MKVTIKKGEILFFRKAKRSTKTTDPMIEAGGHWYGMVLGHVAVGQKDPTHADLLRLIGATGFVSFDDVIEFLGQRHTKTLLRKFQQKYLGTPSPKRWWEFWKRTPSPKLVGTPNAQT